MSKLSPSSTKLFDVIYNYIPQQAFILDIGTGTGNIAIELASRGYRVIAVDNNVSALNAAPRVARVEFVLADARKLPFKDNTFDCVTMQAFLTMAGSYTERDRCIAEAFRVLKQGGIIYVVDFAQNWHNPYYRQRYLNEKEFTGEEGTFRVFDSDGRYLYTAHHFTEKEIVSLLTDKDFQIEYFSLEKLVTRSGNLIYGFLIIARK